MKIGLADTTKGTPLDLLQKANILNFTRFKALGTEFHPAVKFKLDTQLSDLNQVGVLPPTLTGRNTSLIGGFVSHVTFFKIMLPEEQLVQVCPSILQKSYTVTVIQGRYNE